MYPCGLVSNIAERVNVCLPQLHCFACGRWLLLELRPAGPARWEEGESEP